MPATHATRAPASVPYRLVSVGLVQSIPVLQATVGVGLCKPADEQPRARRVRHAADHAPHCLSDQCTGRVPHVTVMLPSTRPDCPGVFASVTAGAPGMPTAALVVARVGRSAHTTRPSMSVFFAAIATCRGQHAMPMRLARSPKDRLGQLVSISWMPAAKSSRPPHHTHCVAPSRQHSILPRYNVKSRLRAARPGHDWDCWRLNHNVLMAVQYLTGRVLLENCVAVPAHAERATC